MQVKDLAMSQIKEAIADIEKAKGMFWSSKSFVPLLDQALAKLRAGQPPAGNFTNGLRRNVREFPDFPVHLRDLFERDIIDACDRLDTSEARLKAMYSGDLSPESRLNGYKVVTAKLKSEVKLWKLRVDEAAEMVESQEAKIERLESSRKELLGLCEEFMEKADNGAADFDDPEPGSIYLRAKAVIAKEKKQGD